MRRAVAALLVAGCSSPDVPGPGPAASAAPASASARPAATPAGSSAAAAPRHGEPYACGGLTCRDFASAADAFAAVLDADKPLVLALGESHALKGAEGVVSTTARFTDELLPKLEGKASSLVLELWVADAKCGKKKVAEVQKQQKQVTEKQADTNQNEFVRLGEKSRSLGIVPFILSPTCDEYDKVRSAGDDAVLVMLEVITKNMREKAKALFGETAKKQPGKMVVTYGGALHNDVAPKKGREAWSFAADLDALAPGRYVEIDLIVPEFIKDTDAWRTLPWYGAYDRERMGLRVVLVTVAPRSYALIFATAAKTHRGAPAPSSDGH